MAPNSVSNLNQSDLGSSEQGSTLLTVLHYQQSNSHTSHGLRLHYNLHPPSDTNPPPQVPCDTNTIGNKTAEES